MCIISIRHFDLLLGRKQHQKYHAGMGLSNTIKYSQSISRIYADQETKITMIIHELVLKKGNKA